MLITTNHTARDRQLFVFATGGGGGVAIWVVLLVTIIVIKRIFVKFSASRMIDDKA